MKEVIDLFDKPKIIGIVADPNQGKSNLIYATLSDLFASHHFQLYSFGLRVHVGGVRIRSVRELSSISNALIVLDEFFSLFDLENRKEHRNIEAILRTMYHSNNIILLAGLPDNYRKFIAAKLNVVIFKQCSISDFVNGSRVKSLCQEYKAPGGAVAEGDPMVDPYLLKMGVGKAVIWNGTAGLDAEGNPENVWSTITVPLVTACDTKSANRPIFIPR